MTIWRNFKPAMRIQRMAAWGMRTGLLVLAALAAVLVPTVSAENAPVESGWGCIVVNPNGIGVPVSPDPDECWIIVAGVVSQVTGGN